MSADARADWLRRRREMLTASDCAAVLGVDPYRGPLAVYADKVGDVEPEQTEAMAWGRRLEGAIAEGYAEETGRGVEDLGAFEIQRHPDLPCLGATLDRVTAGSDAWPAPANGRGPLEIKLQGVSRSREWDEGAPLGYQVQLQIQMACTGAAWGSLAGLIGGLHLEWRDFLRLEAFLAVALPQLEAFWNRVQLRDPPEADGLPGTSSAVRRLWGVEDGETLALDHAALALADQWDVAKARRSTADDEAEDIQNRLRRRLGSASFGALPDGSLLVLRGEPRILRRMRPRWRGRR